VKPLARAALALTVPGMKPMSVKTTAAASTTYIGGRIRKARRR
jgi:hypothetical protein